MAEERETSDTWVESDKEVEQHSSMTKKKKNRERKDNFGGGKKLGGDALLKKKSKKKSKEKGVDSEPEDGVKKSKELRDDSEADDGKKRKKKKKSKKESGGSFQENQRAREVLNDAERETGKRKRDDSDLGSEEEHTEKEVKRKSNKAKQNVDSEVEANNHSKKKTKKKKQNTKKVKFSDQVGEVELVKGKRFTKEEDELIKKAVIEYIKNHALGDDGLTKVLQCGSYPEARGCWKEIEFALPWRAPPSVYHRAHTLFEAGSKGIWTKEDFQLLIDYQKKHGNDWRTLADAMGKHRRHVKDAWRRIRLNKNKGHWSREEYQILFDLVNTDLRMKAYQEKHSKHGMLRDNIPWMAISDQLGTRDHTLCCIKWYDQLTSPMVAKGIWANVDDYTLLDDLTKLDAACVDDVDWDFLLENRDGEACRKRWNQMVRHVGIPVTKTFAEQVEILSERYCPDLAEDRENFDNRPFDPED